MTLVEANCPAAGIRLPWPAPGCRHLWSVLGPARTLPAGKQPLPNLFVLPVPLPHYKNPCLHWNVEMVLKTQACHLLRFVDSWINLFPFLPAPVLWVWLLLQRAAKPWFWLYFFCDTLQCLLSSPTVQIHRRTKFLHRAPGCYRAPVATRASWTTIA